MADKLEYGSSGMTGVHGVGRGFRVVVPCKVRRWAADLTAAQDLHNRMLSGQPEAATGAPEPRVAEWCA